MFTNLVGVIILQSVTPSSFRKFVKPVAVGLGVFSVVGFL